MTEHLYYNCLCNAPEDETDKAYKVWNGKGYSYLAKSQMKDVNIVDDIMAFKATPWFHSIHPWIQIAEL